MQMVKQWNCLFLLALLPNSLMAQPRVKPVTDPSKADADFAIQGEYIGTVAENGQQQKYGVQVAITAKVGAFKAIAYRGGLPGDGWDGKFANVKFKRLTEAAGQVRDGEVHFPSLLGGMAAIKDGILTITSTSGDRTGELKKTERKSPTLGAGPPAGAIVLFDGTSLEHFVPRTKMTEDRLLSIPARTNRKFTDFHLHAEVRIPYCRPPSGHSGIYLQNSYHLAISAGSFGAASTSDLGCGGIRWVRGPDANMSLPPLAWQTFDIDYTAARFDLDGKIIEKPLITIRQNGVAIHDKVVLPATPPFYRGGGTDPLVPEGGPLHFQSHAQDEGYAYRNIWILPK
jgi:hypothetical protein